MNQAAQPTKASNLLSYPLNDFGNGQRLLAMYGDNLLFCFELRKWLVWDGCRFRVDEQDIARKLAQETMLEFTQQALRSGNKDLVRFASTTCLNTSRLTSALIEARPHRPVTKIELDSDPYLLNFTNGTLNCRTGQLRPHSREDRLTKLVEHAYRPSTECPVFLSFLTRAAGAAVVPYLQKAFGYSLLAITSEKVSFLLIGPTNTGKTTLLQLFHDLISDYAGKVDVESLMAKNEDNNTRADMGDLRGVRFCMTSETEENQRLRESKWKRLVQGQGTLRTVRKYENWVSCPETWKIWMDCNHLPVVRSTDDSTWGRFVVISFTQSLSDGEIDRKLPETLREEAEGILAWAVQGALCWQQEGLKTPKELLLAKNQWREEMDVLGQFLKSTQCLTGDYVRAAAQPLYRAYVEWAKQAGFHPLNQTAFGLAMKERFESTTIHGRIFYLGIGLSADCEPERVT